MNDGRGAFVAMDACRAREMQTKLAGQVIRRGSVSRPRIIAGVDVSVSRFSRMGKAAVVLLEYPSLHMLEISRAEGELTFPYIPGLLSFRETPLIIAAWEKLTLLPDLVIVDGQGLAHPRRFGIASHIGVLLDLPSIGCAKSRLTGEHGALPATAGSYVMLKCSSETIGAVVRTKQDVNPLYISTGHKISLRNSISWVLRCCRGYRLPEPTRMAHLAAGDDGFPARNNCGAL
jgi:deoxyribonuclease V